MYRITTLCTYYIPEFVLVLWNIDIISTKRTIDPPLTFSFYFIGFIRFTRTRIFSWGTLVAVSSVLLGETNLAAMSTAIAGD